MVDRLENCYSKVGFTSFSVRDGGGLYVKRTKFHGGGMSHL